MADVIAIVVAAGRGERMGVGTRKQYAPLAGVPVLARSLLAIDAAPEIDGVVVVDDGGARAALEPFPQAARKVVAIVPGGPARAESVAAGLAAAPACEVLVVHDAARPLASPALFSRVVAAAREHGAAAPIVPVRDTVKRVAGGWVRETVDRTGLWLAQTPQAFRAELLLRACAARRAGDPATDEAQAVERIGHAVATVAGEEENVKITTPVDLIVCEALIAGRGGR